MPQRLSLRKKGGISMTWKKRIAGVVSMILVLSILMVPMASIAGNDRITISQNGYYMQKLSNPTAGEGEADGLVTPGDRFNSYAWATGELGIIFMLAPTEIWWAVRSNYTFMRMVIKFRWIPCGSSSIRLPMENWP